MINQSELGLHAFAELLELQLGISIGINAPDNRHKLKPCSHIIHLDHEALQIDSVNVGVVPVVHGVEGCLH